MLTPEEFTRLLNCTQDQVDEIARTLGGNVDATDPHNSQFIIRPDSRQCRRGLILKISKQANKVYFSFHTYSPSGDYREGLRRHLNAQNVISQEGVEFDGLRGVVAENRANTRNGTVCDFYPITAIPPNAVLQNLDELKRMKDALIERLDRANAFTVAVQPSAVMQGENQVVANANATENAMNMEDQVTKLLLATGQIILHGAPGTGKTYKAREIARQLTSDDLEGSDHPHVEIVQFHAGYDYSDFVVGLKPKLVGELGRESVSFDWKRGIFSRFADAAKMAYDNALDKKKAPKYVFIIDEINRADLSRVFGELFSQIEWGYRYREGGNTIGVKLPDGKDPLLVPENLYIIGTMNDIDRSVESMDFALRRRFAWYEITAKESAVILDAKVADPTLREKVKNAMRAINGIVRNPENCLGSEYEIGGAIFANITSCDQDFSQLWDVYILTILKEYLRGNKRKDELLEKMKTAYFDAIR